MQDLRFQLKQALGEEKEVAEEVERVKRVLQVEPWSRNPRIQVVT